MTAGIPRLLTTRTTASSPLLSTHTKSWSSKVPATIGSPNHPGSWPSHVGAGPRCPVTARAPSTKAVIGFRSSVQVRQSMAEKLVT